MKALLCRRYGAPEDVLGFESVEKPAPRPREVLVRVHAVTVNRTDTAIARAAYVVMRPIYGFFRPRKGIMGTDFAGRVEAVGEGTTAFKPGDRIFGFDDMGLRSHAEFLVVREDAGVGTIPEGVPYRTAVSSIEGAHYARNFLNKVDVPSGAEVLVNGGTGAIGSAAVQLLKRAGARVTATAPGAHMAKVEALGAAKVIDYEREDFTEREERFDFVIDAVGKSSWRRCKPLLKPKGAYISSEPGFLWQNLFLSLLSPLMGSRKVRFPVPGDVRESVAMLQDLLARGEYSPLVDRTYPLAEMVDAYRYVDSGRKIGAVVVEVAGEEA